MNPVVAIVGRANVGKSTLFNRLTGRQIAIVADLPGTTRDRVFASVTLKGQEFTLIDTGGLDPSPESSMNQKIKYQVEAAIAEADVIVAMMDVKSGIIPLDLEIAAQLRKYNKPLVLTINKADNYKLESQISDFYRLGLGTPVTISAHHGRGINGLIDNIVPLLPQSLPESVDPNMPRLAILGKPNAGKSMLLNAITGEERAIVDNVPGTTRDAVDSVFNYNGQELILIDTAGIKRRKHAGLGVDYYSLIRSLRAINRCDIALLVTDAAEFITAQDVHIAGYIKDACKGMILVINKWDLLSGYSQKEYTEQALQRLKFISHVPVLFVSAKYGQRVNKIIPEALTVWQERHKQLPNTVIDKLIKEAIMNHAPSRIGTKRLEVIRAYQDGINPPSFSFLVNDPKLVHFSYQRYLENKLRQTFGFSGTSLRLFFKKVPRKRAWKIESRKT